MVIDAECLFDIATKPTGRIINVPCAAHSGEFRNSFEHSQGGPSAIGEATVESCF